MKIARVLLPLNGKDEITPLADAALSLATRFGAHIEGLLPQISPYSIFAPPSEGASTSQIQKWYNDIQTFETQSVDRAQHVFLEHFGNLADVSSSFEAVQGPVKTAVARRAMFADLTIVPSIGFHGDDFWDDVREGALFSSGRPVLVVPKTATKNGVGEHLLIAWSESVEASRALMAAWPFFEAAKSIRVVNVDGRGLSEGALDHLKTFVAAHGLKAKVERIEGGGYGPGERLVEEAAEQEGAMLVMGAYGTRRWIESAFGGATDHVLHACRTPVLMTH
ncbi:MAG: universal stress protein [Methyloligellaceae bacterium]